MRILPAIDAARAGSTDDPARLLEEAMRSALEEMRRPGSMEGSGRRSERVRRMSDAFEIAALILSGYACHLYYNLIGHLASLRGVDHGASLLSGLDRAVPYAPPLVLFYQLAYFVPGLVVLLLLWRIGPDVGEIRRIVASFLALLFAHYALYLSVPTSAAAIRLGDVAIGQGFLAELVRAQYRLATPWCAWPSLHVSACWFFYRVLAREAPRLRWLYLVWFAGMLLGTVAIKIHYALDGVTGLLLAEAAYRGVLVPLVGARALQWSWRSELLRFVVPWGILAALVAGIPLAMRASGYVGPLYVVGAG